MLVMLLVASLAAWASAKRARFCGEPILQQKASTSISPILHESRAPLGVLAQFCQSTTSAAAAAAAAAVAVAACATAAPSATTPSNSCSTNT